MAQTRIKEAETMSKRISGVPPAVHDAADSAWGKWREKLAAVKPPPKAASPELGAPYVDPDAGKPPEQRMIEKIRRRMQEYPQWYEKDPDKVAEFVAAELDRIGAILDRELPQAEGPVPVWDIPLSVFNWLVETPTGESFVHGALTAWSSAEQFNAANNTALSPAEREKLRAPFLEIAPLLLTAVLEELLGAGLWVSFAEKFVGPELKYLEMRVQLPPQG